MGLTNFSRKLFNFLALEQSVLKKHGKCPKNLSSDNILLVATSNDIGEIKFFTGIDQKFPIAIKHDFA